MFTLSEIRTALERGEFFLEYLPTVALRGHRCVGGEALIRWRRGSDIIPPLEFIPLIEDTPLSGLVTYWVIDRVAEELGAWLREQADVHIGINVPPEVFGRGGLMYAAKKANLLSIANKFVIEVTERGVPDRLGIDELNGSHDTGVLIALDDVFADDANLLILSRVRVDMVKIDKSFADRIVRDDWSPETVAGLSALLRTTSVKLVAEGLEHAGQAEMFGNVGVQWGQGWYFSHPLAADDFREYFAAHQ